MFKVCPYRPDGRVPGIARDHCRDAALAPINNLSLNQARVNSQVLSK